MLNYLIEGVVVAPDDRVLTGLEQVPSTGARSDDSDDLDSFTTGFRQLRVQLVEDFGKLGIRRSPFRA